MTQEERNLLMLKQLNEKMATYDVLEKDVVALKKRLAQADLVYEEATRNTEKDFLDKTYSI